MNDLFPDFPDLPPPDLPADLPVPDLPSRAKVPT